MPKRHLKTTLACLVRHGAHGGQCEPCAVVCAVVTDSLAYPCGRRRPPHGALLLLGANILWIHAAREGCTDLRARSFVTRLSPLRLGDPLPGLWRLRQTGGN